MACRALDEAGLSYAVAGGNAVAAWVSTVDEAAIRNTPHVDVMIDRADLDRVRLVLEGAGFHYRHVGGLDVFLDRTDGSVRDAVHILFAGEWVREGEPSPNPTLEASQQAGGFRVLALEALVQIKLRAWRDKDRTHLRDLIDLGLVDSQWVPRLHPVLAERLQSLLDNPEG